MFGLFTAHRWSRTLTQKLTDDVSRLVPSCQPGRGAHMAGEPENADWFIGCKKYTILAHALVVAG